MARDDDDEKPWTRLLLIAVGVALAVALVIGGVVSVLALGAARVSGIDEVRPTATAEASLVMPSGRPTTRVDPYPAPENGIPDEPSRSPERSDKPAAKKKVRAITLRASPEQVSAGERISLTGGYRRREGASLQVQRLEAGRWADFPVTARVSGGRFNTYITTSRTGPTRLRMFDGAAGKASNAVRVQVG
jgi:hypothetical protein